MAAKKRRFAETSSLGNIGTDRGENPSEKLTQDSASVSRSHNLACVFLKRYPYEIPSHGACMTPFANTSRLKEHLYRDHRKPPHCPRCKTVFRVGDEFDQHLNAPERCKQAPSSQKVEGLSNEQVKELKKRERRGCEEEQKWRRIYKIAFPEVDPNQIPNPYCEIEARFQDLELLKAHFQRRVIPATEQMMLTTFGQALTLEMRDQLPYFVLSVVDKLCTEFHLREGLGSSEHPDELSRASHAHGGTTQDTVPEWSSIIPNTTTTDPQDEESLASMSFADGSEWELAYGPGFFLPDSNSQE